MQRRMESDTTLLDLPPELVDPSFVSDRLSRPIDDEHRRLVASIRAVGQQVPILVRPHPSAEGRYQTAYGHRRRDAAAELGIRVRAVVRPMTDAQLVIAQGKENSERRNLSFIERAMFAADLQRRGFDRPTLHAALDVHTAEMTRLLTVAAAIPEEVVRMIGPAPKAGRQRWLQLASRFALPGIADTIVDLLAQPSLQSQSSDRRFSAAIAALRAASADAQRPPERLVDARGVVVGHVARGTARTLVTLDERAAPGLSSLIARELPLLIGRYSAGER